MDSELMDKKIAETVPCEFEAWIHFHPFNLSGLPILLNGFGSEKVEVSKYLYGPSRQMRGRAVRYRLIPIEDPDFGKDTTTIDPHNQIDNKGETKSLKV